MAANQPEEGQPIHTERHVRIICIGAGASGLLFAYKLQRDFRNFSLVIYEKNPEVAGTWWENRYPGYVHFLRVCSIFTNQSTAMKLMYLAVARAMSRPIITPGPSSPSQTGPERMQAARKSSTTLIIFHASTAFASTVDHVTKSWERRGIAKHMAMRSESAT